MLSLVLLYLILMLLCNPWLQVLERHVEKVSDDVIIDLAYHIRCIGHLVALSFIETLLVQLLQLLDDTVIIGIFEVVCRSLERGRGGRVNLMIGLFLRVGLDWGELREANFDVGEAGFFAQDQIVQILS